MLLALSVISRQSQRLGAASYRVFDERGGSIGRGKQADWQIDDPDAVLSGRHAAIRFAGGRFMLEDTSTNGTALNRADALVPKGQLVPLSDGDHIYLGDFELLVQVIPEAAPGPGAAMPPPASAWPEPAGQGSGAQNPAWPAPPAQAAPDWPAPPGPALGATGAWPAPPGPPPAAQPPAWPAPPGPAPGATGAWPAPPGPPPVAQPPAWPAPPGPPATPAAWPAAPGSAPAGLPPAWPSPPATPAPDPMADWATPASGASSAPLIVGGWDDAPDAGTSGGLGGLVGSAPPPPPAAMVDPPSPYGAGPAGYGAPPAGYGPPPVAPGAPAAPAYGVPGSPAYGAPSAPAYAAPAGYAPQPAAYGAPSAAGYAPAPVAGGGSADLNALFAAIGIDPSQVPPDTAAQLGAILRTVTHGLIDVLKARAEVKNQFRMSVTYIKPVENNPLKFARDPEDALHTLFVKRNPGYVGPVEAFHEAFEDLGRHQIAMLAGMQAAFAAVLKRFDPGQIEAACEKASNTHKGLLGGVGKPKYWEFFREHFGRIAEDSDAAFQEFFGQAFVRAYDDQIHRLEEAARQRRR